MDRGARIEERGARLNEEVRMKKEDGGRSRLRGLMF